MQPSIQLTTAINPTSRSPLRRGLLLTPFLLALACFALSPPARAACLEGCNTGLGNTFLGDSALGSNTTGLGNTAVGSLALQFNTTGNTNTAVGGFALEVNTTGSLNTGIGYGALFKNTGSNNTAMGTDALEFNTSGTFNTATGVFALNSNTTGSNNTATGFQALNSNTTGNNNLANGYQALFSNTTGVSNMATGYLALLYNTTGFFNMANGSNAMVHNTTGSYNVAEGLNSLRLNTTGSSNTALGLSALLNNTTGGANIAVGGSAGSALTTGSNNIDIGNSGVAAEAGKIRLGTKGKQTSAYVAGISGVTVAGGVGVVIDTNGHLGTVVSSARYKDDIQPMDKASEAVLALKPVSFRYKKELDPDRIPQFGLVAEDVAKVDPNLVALDESGKPYTVRYEAVNAMLLNEFLKEHRKVEEQAKKIESQDRKVEKLEATVVQQQNDFPATIAALAATVKEQTSQIQKVSDQLAISNAAPRVVANDR